MTMKFDVGSPEKEFFETAKVTFRKLIHDISLISQVNNLFSAKSYQIQTIAKAYNLGHLHLNLLAVILIPKETLPGWINKKLLPKVETKDY